MSIFKELFEAVTPGDRVQTAVTLEAHLCGNCGAPFAMPADILRRRREDGQTFWCPSCGSPRVFVETEVQRLKREKELTEQALERAKVRERYERQKREAAERSRNAYKGQATKAKRRTAAGLCPCCDRNFQNVSAHIEKQHPEYLDAAKKLGQNR